jgi:hypothetical protein
MTIEPVPIPAEPTDAGAVYSIMTRREHAATLILAGLAANPEAARIDLAHLAANAVRLADLLHARLADTAGGASC